MVHEAVTAVLHEMPMAVLLVDAGERIAQANAAAQAAFGAGLAGRALVTVLRQPALGRALEAALREGRRDRVRVVTGHAPETVLLVSVAPAPETVLPGGAILAFDDITALEEAEAMRRDFVANVSHELRTPLTALMGFVETLRGAARDDPAARDRFLAIMEREAGRMNRLVGDLLSLSRVEAEERRRPTAPVDIAGVLRNVIQTLRPRAEAEGVALIAEALDTTAPMLPGPMLPGDADQLTQLFVNLVENAVKYGGSGGEVRIEIEALPHEPVLRGPALKIVVIDRGEGIEALHLPRLTERFYRVDTHRSRAQGGTGLGLAIVKHIVARHRGRLKIDSEKGKGSRFSVILPLS